MSGEQFYFTLNASLAAVGWFNVWLSRKYPTSRRRSYMMNLAGLTIAAYSLVFPAYHAMWMMFFSLNLVAQNPFYARLES